MCVCVYVCVCVCMCVCVYLERGGGGAGDGIGVEKEMFASSLEKYENMFRLLSENSNLVRKGGIKSGDNISLQKKKKERKD